MTSYAPSPWVVFLELNIPGLGHNTRDNVGASSAFCTKCGAHRSAARFCGACGKKFDDPEIGPDGVPLARPTRWVDVQSGIYDCGGQELGWYGPNLFFYQYWFFRRNLSAHFWTFANFFLIFVITSVSLSLLFRIFFWQFRLSLNPGYPFKHVRTKIALILRPKEIVVLVAILRLSIYRKHTF